MTIEELNKLTTLQITVTPEHVQKHSAGKMQGLSVCQICPVAQALREQYPVENKINWRTLSDGSHILHSEYQLVFKHSLKLAQAIIHYDSKGTFKYGTYTLTRI